MLSKNESNKGLPGLRAIRLAVGLTQEKLAKLIEIAKSHLGQIELGKVDCLQATQRGLAFHLTCEVADLHTRDISAVRLSEIRDAHEIRLGQEAAARIAARQAEAGEQKGVA